MRELLVLSYSGCDTCKKALRWLKAHGIEAEVRPIVEVPPSMDELAAWIPASQLPVRKWLNTSGQSYRALPRADVEAADDETWKARLTRDGKLVKRPVLVTPAGKVLVGFKEAEWASALGLTTRAAAERL